MNPLSVIDDGGFYANTSQVKWFISTGDGSGIGYWVKKTYEQSPIVYIDHNIEGSQVVASSLVEFLEIAISDPSGAVNESLDVLLADFDILRERQPEFKNIKRWLKRNVGIEPIHNRDELIARAKRDNANFERWIKKKAESW